MSPVSIAPKTPVTLQPMDVSSSLKAISAVLEESDGRRFTLTLPATSPSALSDAGTVSALEMSWSTPEGEAALPVTLMDVSAGSRRVVAEVLERRGHMRVDASLIFRCSPLSQADYDDLVPRILSQPQEYLEELAESEATRGGGDEIFERLDVVFSNFHRMLADISEQIRHLTELQQGRADAGPAEHRCQVLNISGSGVAFESPQDMPPGTKLRMTFDLQRFPYRSIVCLGEVIRSQIMPQTRGPASHLLQARFTEICEEDRDRIIHYVFKMQRRLLRSRRTEPSHR